jgi:hypothetical protein
LRDAVRDVSDALQAQKGRVYAIGLKLREGK